MSVKFCVCIIYFFLNILCVVTSDQVTSLQLLSRLQKKNLNISWLSLSQYEVIKEQDLYILQGLDPTIFFYKAQNTSKDLDPSDAHFVDVLHTGAGILGQWGPSGHADFYINGGSSQPGCGSDTVFKTLACDHTKVTPYFIESIVTKRGFWAFPCPTLVSFMLGWCSPQPQEYVLMGEHVTHSARGNYYVRTNADPPWAQGPPKAIKEKITREALPILQRLRKQITNKNAYP